MFGTSPGDEDQIDGTKYTLHVKSDFNDTIEVIYMDNTPEHKKNEIWRFLNCYESFCDEEISTRSVHVNAFNWSDVNTFIETGGLIALSVNYNNKKVTYSASPGLNVNVKQVDFQ